MFNKYVVRIRAIINALMITAMLAGLIPSPALTHLARTVAPVPLEPTAEAAAETVAEIVETIVGPTVAYAAPGDNVALNGTATQSSEWGGCANPTQCAADNAIDGNTAGTMSVNMAATNTDQDAWWEVDLGRNIYVDTISTFGRTDCCPEQTVGAYVLVSDTPFSALNFATAQVEADFQQQIGSTNDTITVSTYGRYVRIQQDGAINLVLKEVQIFQGHSATEVSGMVFLDGDEDATLDNGEPGLDGVDVTLFDSDGDFCTTASTSGGEYGIETTFCTSNDGNGLNAGPYRIEYTLPGNGSLDHLEPTIAGGTTVQFVNAGDIVDVGFIDPAGCVGGADLAISCYVNGDADTSSPTDVLVSTSYESLWSNSATQPSSPQERDWLGLGFGLPTQSRHTLQRGLSQTVMSGLREGAATNPLGAIYATDVTNETSTLFVDLAAQGINVGSIPTNANRGLGAPTGTSHDAEAYFLVGKVGFRGP